MIGSGFQTIGNFVRLRKPIPEFRTLHLIFKISFPKTFPHVLKRFKTLQYAAISLCYVPTKLCQKLFQNVLRSSNMFQTLCGMGYKKRIGSHFLESIIPSCDCKRTFLDTCSPSAPFSIPLGVFQRWRFTLRYL